MFSPADFRAIVSGQRRGPLAGAARCALRLAEYPYSWAVRRRNRRFDTLRAPVHAVEVPVISVGNLTLGGTGKTPLVAYVARWLRARELRVAIVSRGYGSRDGGPNDEGLELEQRLPDVPHVQNADRLAGARLAIDELDSQCILLDDGFQHRRLARDLDIVLLDALDPFGYGHVFPRGMLREPVEGLARADLVVLSRADAVDDARRREVREAVTRLAPAVDYAEAAHRPSGLLAASGRSESLESLCGKRVLAFCGIGNPAGFRHTLSSLGCELIELREFPDHHPYGRADVESLIAWTGTHPGATVLTTHKDLVKLGVDRLGGSPLWAVKIKLALTTGAAALDEALEAIASRIPREDQES